jgi:predicted metal-dependent phosphoesterase TrpH
MSDPRNVAHAKKVSQEKKHNATAASPEVPTGQPGKKSATARKKGVAEAGVALLETPPQPAPPAVEAPKHPALEGSLVVLTKLKELEFHSRAHLERLAALSMTVETDLQQPAMVAPLGEVYSAQSTFQTKLTALIEAYQEECDRMQGTDS